VAVFIYHTGLLCILLTWALIRWDGHRVPSKFVLTTLILAVALPLFMPLVHPVPWTEIRPDWLADCGWCQRVDTALVGGFVGAAFGALQSVVSRIWRHPATPAGGAAFDLAATGALVGSCLGWQALVSAALLAASIRVIVSTVTGGRFSRNGSDPWIYLAIAVFVQIVAWRVLEDLDGWPGSRMTIAQAIVPMALAMYFSIVAAYVESRGSVAR
jgi:hypothetical protein